MAAKTITEELTLHHDEMRQIIKEVKKESSKFIILKKHLDVHHELEEDLLLSLLNKKDDIKDDSLESQEEHFVLNILLLDLADFPKDSPRWKVKFGVLTEIINHHLDEEEEDLFPEAEKRLSKEKQVELGQRFAKLKEKRINLMLET